MAQSRCNCSDGKTISIIQGQGHGRKKTRNSIFSQCNISIGDNSDSVEHMEVNFACSMKHGVFGCGRANGVTAIFVT